MFENEKVMTSLVKQETDISSVLDKLTGELATDGIGLSIGTLIAIRRPDPDNEGQYIEEIQTAGYRDWDNNEQIQQDDIFRIYSVTKTFTSSIFSEILQDTQYSISLDDPIEDWVAIIEDKTGITGLKEKLCIHKGATLSNLLMHTSGIGSYSHPKSKMFEESNTSAKLSYSLGETLLLNHVEQGENDQLGVFCYSDTGFNLLALICEVVTGKSYEELVAEFCKKNGLTNTFCTDHLGQHPHHHLAQGYGRYQPDKDTPPSSSFNYETSRGTGGILSNASDLLQWSKQLYELRSNPGPMPLSTKTKVQGPIPSRVGETYYSNGMMEINYDDTTSYGHGGYARGGRSKMYYYPEQDTSVVILESFEYQTVDIAKELHKQDPQTFPDIKLTTRALRAAYTTDDIFNRTKLNQDWRDNQQLVTSKATHHLKPDDKTPSPSGCFGNMFERLCNMIWRK